LCSHIFYHIFLFHVYIPVIFLYLAALFNICNSLIHIPVQKINFNRVIVSVCCGSAQTEMHSSSRDFNICLDVDKRALYSALFSLKYLHEGKSNMIIQYHDMKDGFYDILHTIQTNTQLPILILFQHPSPTTEIRHRQALIKAALHCIMCLFIIDEVQSIHFVYDWNENSNTCWQKNELRLFLLKECYLSSAALLHSITFTDDINISYINTSMINHPVYGITKKRGWAQMKFGQERAFSVIKCPQHPLNSDR